MNDDSARELLDILIENALRILRAGYGLHSVESVFFDIIDLLRSQPTLKAYYLRRVKATLALDEPGQLEPGVVPRELVELTAHELQWEELRQLANERIKGIFGGDMALAVSDIAKNILAAFNPQWEDREFYRRYSGHEGQI